jgi:hypothetical protein
MSSDTVVKTYGRDALLVWWNPIIAAAMSMAGLRVGVLSNDEVVSRMERDALEMLSRGYRVVSSDEKVLALLFPPGKTTSYYTVTYRRESPPVAR